MSRRITTLTVVALGIALLVTAFFLLKKEGTPHRAIRVGYLPIIASLPLFVARDEGFFRKEGLTVDLIEFSDSNRLSDALATGMLDVAPTVALAPMANLEASFPNRIRVFSVSRMTKEDPFDAIVVRANSPVNSLKDLEAGKIGTFPGTTATALLRHFLKKRGVITSNILIIPLAPPNQLAATESGSVDALHAYEPILSLALSKGYRQIEGSIYASLHEPAPIGCSAISRKFERDNPDLAARFLSAFDSSIQFIRTHQPEARRILEASSIVPPAAAKHCSLLNLSLTTEDATLDIDAYLDILRRLGEVPKPIRASDLSR